MTMQAENFKSTDDTNNRISTIQPEQWNSVTLLGDKAVTQKNQTTERLLPNFAIDDSSASGTKLAGAESVKAVDAKADLGIESARASATALNSTDDGLPHPAHGYGSYHYGYQFNTSENWTKADIAREIAQNYNKYFTFSGDKPSIVPGETINLKGPLGEKEPVKVLTVNENGFAFESLPGHSEGAGRIIAFRIVPEPSETPGQLNWELHVDAGGRLSRASLLPGADRMDKMVWQQFDDNLNNRLPKSPNSQKKPAAS